MRILGREAPAGLRSAELHPQVAQESFTGADVGQGRDVGEAVLPCGQQGGGQDGQGGVLGPADLHFPLQGNPAFNDDFIHY